MPHILKMSLPAFKPGVFLPTTFMKSGLQNLMRAVEKQAVRIRLCFIVPPSYNRTHTELRYGFGSVSNPDPEQN